MPPLSLDDDQLADLMRLAGPIPIEHRDAFLQHVAAALGNSELGPGALYRVARDAQRKFLNGVPSRAGSFHAKYSR
jgi:hypothetical protein